MITELPLAFTRTDRERLEAKYRPLIREKLRLGSFVSFVGNTKVPILRLCRFKEAFSFFLVEELLRRFGIGRGDIVFDPFCGMGTTMFVASLYGACSIGVDRLPVAVFVASTLPLFLKLKPGILTKTLEELSQKVGRAKPAHYADNVPLMRLAFDPPILERLRKWKNVILDIEDEAIKPIFLLLLMAIIEQCSYTSKDGQFLRLKRDKRPVWPDDALKVKVAEAEEDVRKAELMWDKSVEIPQLWTILGDSRDLSSIPWKQLGAPNAIITSPPYPNRYDYTRSYCLELCLFFVNSAEELKSLRHSLLRSHIESKLAEGEAPPHPAVSEVVDALSGKRLNNPRIPHMLIAYFIDMKKCIQQWAKVLAPEAKVAMVVDNVRFEGELVPVDLILSEMAEEEAGFVVEEIIVCRYKGNSSQQMRKYGRVPVRESVVVWRRKK